jgi:hypothetical protein
VRRLFVSAPAVPAVLVAVLLAGCDPGTTLTKASGHGTHTVYCTIMADPPGRAGTAVQGNGRFRCDAPGPGSLTMTVSLERRGTAGAWAAVASQQFTAAGVDTTRTRTEKQRTRGVAVPCAAGTYRVVSQASWVSGGGTRKAFTMTGPSVSDPCGRR